MQIDCEPMTVSVNRLAIQFQRVFAFSSIYTVYHLDLHFRNVRFIYTLQRYMSEFYITGWGRKSIDRHDGRRDARTKHAGTRPSACHPIHSIIKQYMWARGWTACHSFNHQTNTRGEKARTDRGLLSTAPWDLGPLACSGHDRTLGCRGRG